MVTRAPYFSKIIITITSIFIVSVFLHMFREKPASDKFVNVYTARKEEMLADVFADFTTKTGIKVNILHDESGKLISRMESEDFICNADVFIASDVVSLERAKKKRLLAKFSEGFDRSVFDERLGDDEGYWIPLSKRARIIVHSKDRVLEDSIKKYTDLGDPKWKGRVLTTMSSSPYNQSLIAAMILRVGQQDTISWIKSMSDNFARKPRGGDTDQIRSILSGEGDIALTNSYYLARLVAKDDSLKNKLSVVFPDQAHDGTHINVSGGAVTACSKRKDLAELLLSHMVSEDSQKVYIFKNYEYPVLNNVTFILPDPLVWMGSFKEDSRSLKSIADKADDAADISSKSGWL